MTIKTTIMAILAVLVLGGCSTKEVSEFNKPADYWYVQMIASASNGNLEKADEYFSSLQSEHIGSPLLAEATLILAQAHLKEEEYLLSEHFLDEYIKRYADSSQREFAEFLKVKAKYMGLPNPRRDQGLISEAMTAAEMFKRNYPGSVYTAQVDTMRVRLFLARAKLNESIAGLYDRLDKPKAAAYYRSLDESAWIDWDTVEHESVPWYRSIFEGDGTASWYGIMIPDTQSVVSRNSHKDDGEEN